MGQLNSPIFFSFLYILFCSVYCPPVLPISKDNSSDVELDAMLGTLDYSRYLTQVIKELQSDVDFNRNLMDVKDSDTIANSLKFASGRVRSKLDEQKRIEIARLNKLQSKWNRRRNDDSHPLEMPPPPRAPLDMSHLDDMASDSFNPEDLKRLIDRTSEIFNKIDQRDEETYKYHEMEKKAVKKAEFEKIADEKKRKESVEMWAEGEKQRKSHHKTIHNPGSIEHLKSVWTEDDHMDADSFNSRSFFFMHDINNDGNWDIAELETLMQRELDKVYDPTNNDTDIIERYHEMTRMRNALLSAVDIDRNHLISLDEYSKWVLGDQFKEDKEWKVQEEVGPNYSDDEFNQFYEDYKSRHPGLYQPPISKPTTNSP